MNSNASLACITCEFESIDLADLGIGRLLKTTGGVRSIHVRRCAPPRHTPDLAQDSPISPGIYPVMDFSSAYMPGTFFAPALWDSRDEIEPRQIRSVTAEIICNRKNARDVAGRLTSLGASHIHIR